MIKEQSSTLVQWVRDLHSLGSDVPLDDNMDLVEAGYIDSLGFVGLMVQLEEMGAQHLDELIAQPERFRTIRSVVEHCFA